MDHGIRIQEKSELSYLLSIGRGICSLSALVKFISAVDPVLKTICQRQLHCLKLSHVDWSPQQYHDLEKLKFLFTEICGRQAGLIQYIIKLWLTLNQITQVRFKVI